MSIGCNQDIGQYDIFMPEGTDYFGIFSLYQDDNINPLDISLVSAELRVQIGGAVKTVVCAAAGNVVTVSIAATEVFAGKHGTYQLDATMNTGKIIRLIRGSFHVEAKL